MTNRSSKDNPIDPVFLITFFLLVLVGLVILQTASSIASYLKYGNHYRFFLDQLISGIIPGIVIFFTCAKIHFVKWQKISPLILISLIIINLMVLVPGIGVTINGASRWIDIGITTLQPSELLKLGIILYLGMLFSKLGDRMNRWSSIALLSVILIVIVGVVAIIQSNLSTTFILLTITASMLFQSKISLGKLAVLGTVGIVAVCGFVMMEDYRMERVQTYFGRGETQDPLNEDYHVRQNLIAVGSGGITGVGWNQSRQKFRYVPEAIADSVFAVYAEESGFIGVVALMLLYTILAVRMLWLAGKIKNQFGQYILIGVTTWFIVQMFLNVGSTLQIIPLTGMTLPFVSYGSSSLWVLFAAFGIVANITKERTVHTESHHRGKKQRQYD